MEEDVFEKSNKIIDEKQNLIKQLDEKNEAYLKANIKYKNRQNDLWLDTDFGEVLGKSRPTVDEKKAYISRHSIDLKEEKDRLYNEISNLKLLIEFCDDKLGFL